MDDASDPRLQAAEAYAFRALVAHLEAELRDRGLREVVLHARDHAIGFYARLGYAPFGEPYEEVGIPHRNMRKTL